MIKKYPSCFKLLSVALLLTVFASSCKKSNSDPTPAPVKNFATIGLYEYTDGTNRRVFADISGVGTATGFNFASVFDTGSTGMTIDASGLIPASMITTNGFVFTGDSTVVNGITITKQTYTVAYGDANSGTKEYGNLAYATVTVGDANGFVTTPRIPFFLYYKAVDMTTGKSLSAHSNDVFGVASGVAIFASGSTYVNSPIGSPLSYFSLPSGVTNGFKLGLLDLTKFGTTSPTYVPGLLTIGLTPTDLNSSGFVWHALTSYSLGGYSPDITATLAYNSTTIAANILLDTGTPNISILENPSATSNITTLAANSTVKFTTSQGFSYSYNVVSNYNNTVVERTSYSQDTRTIFSIDFFVNNEYMMDYSGHRLGLKNN
jgi:hypothetical protein